MVKAGKKLRWIGLGHTGVEKELYPELVHSPVVLTNTKRLFAPPVADTAFALMLGSDTWFLVATLWGGDAEATWLNASYLLPYVGLAASACHPSIRMIGAPVAPQPTTLSRRRLVVLAFAALVTPLLLGLRYATDQDLGVPLVVAGTVVSFLLVGARMSGLVIELESSATMAFAHCPFRDLAIAHPELVCALHRGMVEGFVAERGDGEVTRFGTLLDREPCQVELVVR